MSVSGHRLLFARREIALGRNLGNTSDRRTIRWWECELVDTDGSRRIRHQAFFSIGEAKSWASAQGYPVNEDAASSPDA
jgi:hypothetical protein